MKIAALEALAPLFRYPDAAFPEHLAEAQRLVPAVESFGRAASGITRAALETIYTSTFDLAPSCSPYLGVHLFGDDSRARARLMLGLQRGGAVGELPDHIAEVLGHASRFETEEWKELEEFVLVPALVRMELLLGPDNPYRLLVEAVLAQLRIPESAFRDLAPSHTPEPKNCNESVPPAPHPLRAESGGSS